MTDVNGILARYGRLKAVRDGYWLQLWREVREYVYPTYSDFMSEGGARGQQLYDTTAVEARKRLAAGMYQWMAPPDKRWFELMARDEELAELDEVKDYFSQVSKKLAFAMANSNWSSALIQCLNNLACGLDGIMWCEPGKDGTTLSFRSWPVETVCYAENADGEVDTLFREFEMSCRQLLQQFPDGDFPEEVAVAAGDPRRCDEKRKILHAVMPRPDRDPGMADKVNFPVADIYIDLATKRIISEGGFEELPFAVCRFEKSDNESYGRGPGVDKLPDIKMLNRMRQAYILASEHQADPSYLVPDGSLVDRNFNRDPGAVIFYKSDLQGMKPEILPNYANLQRTYQDIQEERAKIKEGFFWDIFDPLGDLKQITATEAEIRNEGKMIPFAPIAGSLHSELFRRIIHRVYGICARGGLLPEVPEALMEVPDYKVDFVSKIALSIKKLESMAWLQTEAALAGMSQAAPQVMDNFDVDEIARDIALANGTNPKWMISVDDRDAGREQRAAARQQAEQQQQLTAAAGQLGQMTKAPETGSPLDLVLNGQGV